MNWSQTLDVIFYYTLADGLEKRTCNVVGQLLLWFFFFLVVHSVSLVIHF